MVGDIHVMGAVYCEEKRGNAAIHEGAGTRCLHMTRE